MLDTIVILLTTIFFVVVIGFGVLTSLLGLIPPKQEEDLAKRKNATIVVGTLGALMVILVGCLGYMILFDEFPSLTVILISLAVGIGFGAYQGFKFYYLQAARMEARQLLDYFKRMDKTENDT